MILYTGAGGYEVFMEAFENAGGLKRIYLTKKPMRIITQRIKHKIRRHLSTQQYYILVKKTT